LLGGATPPAAQSPPPIETPTDTSAPPAETLPTGEAPAGTEARTPNAEGNPAEPTSGDFYRALFARDAQRDQTSLAAIGITDTVAPGATEQAPQDEPVDFDGGVREPAPPPSNPDAEHADLVYDLLAPKTATHRGGGWWAE
jgi:hypothetical protein